jgi:hypothetical protein
MIKYLLKVTNKFIILKSYTQVKLAQYQVSKGYNATSDVDLLQWAMRAVSYRCIAMAIKMASNVGVFFHCCCFAWDPGSCRGNREQEFA